MKTVSCFMGRLTLDQRKKYRKLGGSKFIGKVLDAVSDETDPVSQLVAQLEARIAEAETTINFLRTENVRIRRGALPSCISCGGWIKPEQGGECLPCVGERPDTSSGGHP
jgi:hypothetical protein